MKKRCGDGFNFNTQLKKGLDGEKLLLSRYPWITKTDGLKGDFIVQGKKLELKTDYYDPQERSTFFMERYSDIARKTPGGPWQALEHKCFYYAYFFPKRDIMYLFQTKQLVDRLESLNLQRLIEVKNNTHITGGYIVERYLFLSKIWSYIYRDGKLIMS